MPSSYTIVVLKGQSICLRLPDGTSIHVAATKETRECDVRVDIPGEVEVEHKQKQEHIRRSVVLDDEESDDNDNDDEEVDICRATRVYPKRNMSEFLEDGALISHRISNKIHTNNIREVVWEGKYNKTKNCIVHMDIEYRSPSGFGAAHRTKIEGKGKGRGRTCNGWKECRTRTGDESVSLADYHSKMRKDK